mgnify:CR=1 FL=1
MLQIRFLILIPFVASMLIACSKDRSSQDNVDLQSPDSSNINLDQEGDDTGKIAQVYHDLETDEYFFDLETYGNFSPKGGWDGRIIQIGKNSGEKSILIESVRKTIEFDRWNEILIPFAFDSTKQILYLDKVLEATEGSRPSELWKYNLESKKFLPINFRFLGEAKNVKQVSIFPLIINNGLRVIRGGFLSLEDNFSGAARYLLLYNLQNETVSVLVQLSANESLNAGYYALLENFDISLVDKDSIQYSVFDQSKAEPDKEIEKPILEKRIIKLPL